MTPVVAFVGHSNSGKTTFLEKLIRVLKQKGISVCVVKHTHHQPDAGHQGKDTRRFIKAGADKTILHSKDKVTLSEDAPGENDISAIAEKYGAGVDIVLAEGYKKWNGPKIEISRKEKSEELLIQDSHNLIALIANHKPHINVPIFGLEEINAVADFLIQRFIK